MASRSSVHGHGAEGQKTRHGGLQLRPLNVERGRDRFPLSNDILPPRTSHWRCNLTALSQRRNLLFMACSNQIYVWEPAGASQTLGTKPSMIINPVMKEPHARGYIQPTSPHEINSILVDDLGREEVLLLVTDSGNVCGYRVEAAFSALKRGHENGKPRPLDSSEVDPFFIEHVGSSAWGLAIHKFARLIAVSANTGLVTVFAFALVNTTSENGDDSFRQLEEDDDFTECNQTWLHIKTEEQFEQLQGLMPEKHRTRNIKLSYSGHFTNIPSVGFLNSDFDPNGMWMVSTDINDKTLVWKVWESLGPFNEYQLDEMAPKNGLEVFLRDGDRGWSVIALDPRTFHWVKSEEEACGGRPERHMKYKQEILDLSKLTKRLPDVSRLYNYFPPAVKAEPEEAVLPDIFESDCRINGSSEPQEKRKSSVAQPPVAKSLRRSNSPDTFSHRAVDGSIAADEMSEDSASEPNSNALNQPAAGAHALLRALANSQTTDDPVSPAQRFQLALFNAAGGNAHEVQALLGETMSELEEEGDEDLDPPPGFESGSEDDEDVDSDYETYQILDPPPSADFPILHFSHSNICLIPHPFASTASVVCGAPLSQRFAHPIVSIHNFDRFNMVKYIPEHGIVVAVSQKGRAAIIALTESYATGRSFRVDWIVPLESQEKYGERPLVPLLGMSVSPMQGFEIPPDAPHIPCGDGERGKYTNGNGNPDADPEPDINDLVFQYRDTDTNTSSPQTHQGQPDRPLTLPESHARATRAYQPEESWRGWNPSRRYRLLLMYADHTVMSYEFWYKWDSSAGASASAGNGAGNANGECDDDERGDEYLIL